MRSYGNSPTPLNITFSMILLPYCVSLSGLMLAHQEVIGYDTTPIENVRDVGVMLVRTDDVRLLGSTGSNSG